jgi:hypothetical protein
MWVRVLKRASVRPGNDKAAERRTMRCHDNLEKEGLTMNLEIHKPELVQRVNAHIQTGLFHDADEVLEKALDALDEKAPAQMSPRAEPARRSGLD